MTHGPNTNIKTKTFFPFLFALWLSAPFLLLAQQPIPELWGHRVHDDAQVLSAAAIDSLEKNLALHEKKTSNQIAVLVIKTLQDEVLEEYSLRVAEQWKLGTSANDNGVLLLVVVDDHHMRIEVGQGLQGVLTDAQCSRIIRDEMAPEFRRGNFDGGIQGGVTAIIASIAGEYQGGDEDGLSRNEIILIVAACLLFLLPLMYTFYKEFTGPRVATSSGYSSSSTSSDSSDSGFPSSSSDSSFSGGGGSFDGGGSSGSW